MLIVVLFLMRYFSFHFFFKGARDAYKSAHRVSAMVSGVNTPPTLDLKSLSERPPTTVQELRARYDASA